MRRWHLTDTFCKTRKAEKQTDFFDDVVYGLALRVSPTAKSWTVHYSRPSGKRARLTLGRYPALSLATARTKAEEAKSRYRRWPRSKADRSEYFARHR